MWRLARRGGQSGLVFEDLRQGDLRLHGATPPIPVVHQHVWDSARDRGRSQGLRAADEHVLERMAGGQQQSHAARFAHVGYADLADASSTSGRADFS